MAGESNGFWLLMRRSSVREIMGAKRKLAQFTDNSDRAMVVSAADGFKRN
jgi:hypothetical protein